jgi:CRISPR-associated protein Cmx8
MRRQTQTGTAVDSVTVRYDLFDLPTAQHKAGLAGLVLQLRSMTERKRSEDGPIPEVVELTATSASVRFTQPSVQALFDDAYAARKAAPLRPRRGRARPPEPAGEEAGTAEDAGVEPIGYFLRDHYPDEDGLWLKLWRNMLWAIPRGIPKTRTPFEQRAAGLPCKEGLVAWQALVKADQARADNRFFTAEVASSLWLGAQEFNAERVPFVGRAEHNLLLHFWPLTTLVFVPQEVKPDGEAKFAGYALAIPEVSHLVHFCDEYPEMLHELSPAPRAYRPAEAVIDLPEQGALEFLEHLARLVRRRAERKQDFIDSVGSVEFLHLAKVKNTVKLMAAGRVSPRPRLLDQYEAIAGRPGQPPPFRNPLFRRGLMLGLLRDRPWYAHMAAPLTEWPWPWFVRSEKSPRQIPGFWADAATKFRVEADEHRHEMEVRKNMPAAATDPALPSKLPLLIHHLVRTYILRKVEGRTGLTWEEVRQQRNADGKIEVPRKWTEAREKVAADAFLAARSRREQDFVDFFTATFCSVKQYLPEDDFCEVAEALLTRPDDVKTLTLLALSANS